MNDSIPSVGALLALALMAPAATAQFTFSIDWKGPTIAQTGALSTVAITEADILTFGPGAPGFGALPRPAFALTANNLGLALYNSCVGHLPGQACGIEVDAISLGLDSSLPFNSRNNDSERIWFSTDEFASGLPQAHLGATVLSEGGAVGDLSADVFVRIGFAVGPLGPLAGPGQHVGVFDGNGQVSAAPANHLYPGIGLVEPNLPNTTVPNSGDNLDAFDIGGTVGFPTGGYYISVDSSIADPLTSANNTSTSSNQGVSGADVLHVSTAAAAPVVYAAATSLGLDLAGADTDDLDALVLAENGNGVFDPSSVPYDWGAGSTDMLLFSVRRGSAVIGMPDSQFGVPIEPGDILTTPRSMLQGGLSPYPAILFAAETLGLRTQRTHGATYGDDIDGLDISSSPCFDCNNNGVEDAVDIATGSSSDANDNGIPDECEAIDEYCYCDPPLAPCGNDAFEAGCGNSTGGGAHLDFTGTQRLSHDDLELRAAGLPPGKMGLFYMGGARNELAFGDGLRCVAAGKSGIFRYAPQSSGAAGILSEGPGIVALSCARFGPNGCITAGSTWNFQSWYRDPQGPCGQQFNTSNGIEVQFGL